MNLRLRRCKGEEVNLCQRQKREAPPVEQDGILSLLEPDKMPSCPTARRPAREL